MQDMFSVEFSCSTQSVTIALKQKFPANTFRPYSAEVQLPACRLRGDIAENCKAVKQNTAGCSFTQHRAPTKREKC